MNAQTLDDLYQFGDVYETLDACDSLELLLGRLKRRRILDDREWRDIREQVAGIRTRLESHVTGSALSPNGPRLP